MALTFKLNRMDGGQATVEVPTSTLLGSTVIVALVSAVATLVTNLLVEIPKNRASTEIQREAQLLATQKFQLELLQKALHAKSPEDRVKSLRFLEDMKLLAIPSEKLAEFTKMPETVPQWAVETSVPAPDAAKKLTP